MNAGEHSCCCGSCYHPIVSVANIQLDDDGKWIQGVIEIWCDDGNDDDDNAGDDGDDDVDYDDIYILWWSVCVCVCL